MDSCCAIMKPNPQPVQISSRGFDVESKKFWGHKIKGSFKNKLFYTKFCESSFRSLNSSRKIKPGVAFSVFTQDVDQEILVIFFILLICF